MSKILIFGGSGFLGSAFVSTIYKEASEEGVKILVVARNEGNLISLKEQFPLIEIMPGDITDPWIVKKAMAGVTECFAMAAMKHVGLAESEVKVCINTNVIGMMNIINESLISKPRLLMFVSTDKASQPSGVYGCSKKIGERLMAEAEKINPDTKYRTVRYGNVIYSTGSVLCKWRDKMLIGEEVIVTDPDATRFFWSVEQAIELIFDCINNAKDAGPYVPSMKAIRIGDLLDAMMEKYGKVAVKKIGLQRGENLHEFVAENGTSSYDSLWYTKEEISQLI